MDTNKKYSHAGIGGTFDRLHAGHHALLNKALSISKKVTIGLTIDDFSSHKNLHQIIRPYKEREEQLINYLKSIDSLENVNTTPLDNIYGPTITDKTIDCVVVTDLTYDGAEKINQKRQELNQPTLPIIKAELIKDKDNKYLSSTRIRQGIVNRQGEIYTSFISNPQEIDEKQKEFLRYPQGNIFSSVDELNSYISQTSPTSINLVGDITLSLFLKNNLPFNLGFFDGKTQRKPNHEVEEITKSPPKHSFTNNPGTINPEIIDIYKKLTKNLDLSRLEKADQIIKVEGEEDLIAVALVLLQPLQSVVIYGQPNDGLVVIEITEDKKEEIKRLLIK